MPNFKFILRTVIHVHLGFVGVFLVVFFWGFSVCLFLGFCLIVCFWFFFF